MIPPCPDFEHDWVEHRHPDGWRLTLMICRLCGQPRWPLLVDSVVAHYVIPAEEAGRRAALGRPGMLQDAVRVVETAAEVAMAAGASSTAQVAAWARQGAGRWLRRREAALNRHRRYPRGKGVRWRWTVLGRRWVQVKVRPWSVAVRVGRLVLAWRYDRPSKVFTWPTVTLLALGNYSHGWGLEVWPRQHFVVFWNEAGVPYDRPGILRTPAGPHER